MGTRACPGLPADWPNAWLAAVGATVLAESADLQLSWTEDPVPVAVLSSPSADPIDLLTHHWPTAERFADMPIAGHHPDSTAAMERKVPIDAWRDRAQLARSHPDHWTLTSTVTDLALDQQGHVAHAPFDPPGPGTIKWLHHRVVKTASLIDRDRLPALLTATLDGTASRVKDNGLGFDGRRLAGDADATAKHVDPIIEVLAFFGLALLPARGDGVEARWARARQRGWVQEQRRSEFRYVTWTSPLDRWGIDALFDLATAATGSTLRALGITSQWATVMYNTPRGSKDKTVGYLARPLAR